MATAFSDSAVKSAFDNYPKTARNKLLKLREMVFRVAGEHDEIGEVTEILKWEVPSYLTHKPKSGTTVRLAWSEKAPEFYTISVHCQTTLIDRFKEMYPQFEYDGNRSIVLDVDEVIPEQELLHFFYLALTYHSRKKNMPR